MSDVIGVIGISGISYTSQHPFCVMFQFCWGKAKEHNSTHFSNLQDCWKSGDNVTRFHRICALRYETRRWQAGNGFPLISRSILAMKQAWRARQWQPRDLFGPRFYASIPGPCQDESASPLEGCSIHRNQDSNKRSTVCMTCARLLSIDNLRIGKYDAKSLRRQHCGAFLFCSIWQLRCPLTSRVVLENLFWHPVANTRNSCDGTSHPRFDDVFRSDQVEIRPMSLDLGRVSHPKSKDFQHQLLLGLSSMRLQCLSLELCSGLHHQDGCIARWAHDLRFLSQRMRHEWLDFEHRDQPSYPEMHLEFSKTLLPLLSTAQQAHFVALVLLLWLSSAIESPSPIFWPHCCHLFREWFVGHVSVGKAIAGVWVASLALVASALVANSNILLAPIQWPGDLGKTSWPWWKHHSAQGFPRLRLQKRRSHKIAREVFCP